MKCHFALVADHIVVDERTNRVSVFNILEQIQSSTFPMVIPQTTIFFYLERQPDEPSTIEATVVISLNETELTRSPIALQFEDAVRHRATVQLRGLLVPRPGNLTIAMVEGTAMVGSWTILVEAPEQPSVIADPPAVA